MNIVLGASGQVGGAIVDRLLEKGLPVTAVIRDPENAHALAEKGATVGIADLTDIESLRFVFNQGETLFVITPETGKSEDIMRDTKAALDNCRAAIEGSTIKKIVGLSSLGAHLTENSGNLYMSYLLEHAFEDLPQQKVFLRPAYYYSNWALYMESAKESGTLSTFFPPDLKLPMVSPIDVAELAADIMAESEEGKNLYELTGPELLSSADVAQAMSEVFGKPVEARQIPEKKWGETLELLGFTLDATKNFIEMTQAVIEGRVNPDEQNATRRQGHTRLLEYFQNIR